MTITEAVRVLHAYHPDRYLIDLSVAVNDRGEITETEWSIHDGDDGKWQFGFSLSELVGRVTCQGDPPAMVDLAVAELPTVGDD